MSPFQSEFKVTVAKDPVLDAWCGARRWAMQPNFDNYVLTKSEYEEKGGEWFKEHFVTNRCFTTPTTDLNASGLETVADSELV